MSGLHIKSDYSDYYDIMNNEKSIITYNRFIGNCNQRGSDLKYLRSIGIKTIEIKQVNEFFRGDGPIVVYKNTKGHHGEGKEIMSVDDALRSYSNYTASKYIMSDSQLSIKYLQIGKRRFTLYFQKDKDITLDKGKLVDIKESTPAFNSLIGLPIFSIDYISNNREMLATDFNSVENLSLLGFGSYIKSEEVVSEIIDALTAYNRI